MNEKAKSNRTMRDSWYHHRWFRILLVLIGIDMLILGASFALNYNLLIFFAGVTNTVVRAIIGILYMLVAGYIIKHGLYYDKAIKEAYMASQREEEGQQEVSDIS